MLSFGIFFLGWLFASQKSGAVPKVMSVALIEPFDRRRNHSSK